MKSPLTETDYNKLTQLQKGVKHTLEYLQKCKKCKLDVQAEIDASNEQLEIIALMKKQFFPEQP